MKTSHKLVAGVVISIGLAVAVAAYSQPFAGPGMGPGMMGGGPGMMRGGPGMGPRAMAGGVAGPFAAQQLMTPEEHAAFQEKMRKAATPEERFKLAQSTRAEMQKRAKEKGITLPGPATAPFSGTR